MFISRSVWQFLARGVGLAALVCGGGFVAHAQSTADAPRLISVAIDARGLSDGAYQRFGLLKLQRRMALRLVQEGFAVVANDRRPEVRLALSVTSQQLYVEGIARTARTARGVPRGTGSLDGFHLEVLHQVLDIFRELAPALRGASAGRVRNPRPTEPSPDRIPPRKPLSSEPWVAEVSIVPAGVYRVDATDAQLRLGARWGASSVGFALQFSVLILPAVESQLTAIEWALQVGASWRLPLSRRWSLEPAVLVGVLAHHFVLDASAVEGVRVDALINLVLAADVRLTHSLRLRGWVSPGLSEQSRNHRLDGRLVWQRAAFRVEAGMGLAWALGEGK